MISVRSGSKHHLRTSLSVSSSEAAKTGPVTPVVNTNGPSPPTRCVLTRFFFPPKHGGNFKLLGHVTSLIPFKCLDFMDFVGLGGEKNHCSNIEFDEIFFPAQTKYKIFRQIRTVFCP